ncbi:hypothetical protein ACWFNS_14350 [Oerskovia enterophila]
MKFKKAIAVIATTAALVLAVPSAANAQQTTTYRNPNIHACQTLHIYFSNASGGLGHAYYPVAAGLTKTVSVGGQILSADWHAGC